MKALAAVTWFALIFVAIQFVPLSESAFHPFTPWHVLAAAFLDADLPQNSIAAAIGDLLGDAAFAATVVWVSILINRWVRRRSERISQSQGARANPLEDS